ncbi:hypothetical protein MKK75_12855 [Methylobacterium sp. J-030]|uniref:hypothetical protein n=1 Tax=Methylobacterium sp. J-030 TaxID=2836627 RepID=UPI001FBA8DAA|nr:hypothetical protein [Methylobacterium sp. J-030]MCJ2069667.1 hypothetical protein [Methylobacterium sp. J-030]
MITALPDPPTPASVLALIQGIERHGTAPAAIAFRSALFRAGLEADAAGGLAALAALVDAVAASDPDRADTRTAILCGAWADLIPGHDGEEHD